jgi:hypothetical protein
MADADTPEGDLDDEDDEDEDDFAQAPDDDGWKAARQAVSDHFAAKDKAAPVSVQKGLARYTFRVGRAGGSFAGAVVRGTKVVEERGLAPLGAHLKELKVLETKSLSPDEMMDLLHHYEAWPPARKTAYLYGPGVAKDLAPHFEWQGKTAAFVMHYPQQIAGDPPGPPRYDRASLIITDGAEPSWKIETKK